MVSFSSFCKDNDDYAAYCAGWASPTIGYCTEPITQQWMLKNCKFSCQACDDTDIPTTSTTTMKTTSPHSACPDWVESSWIGDGQCNDETNIEECGYDGGDCCGPSVEKKYCQLCICHNDTEISIKGT